MNKIKIKRKYENKENIIPMSEMKPGEIGEVVEGERHQGHIVMRTMNKDYMEVMDLTQQGEDECWTGNHQKGKVRLLPKAVIHVYPDGDGEE